MLAALGNMRWFPAHSDLAITLLTTTVLVGVIEFAQLRQGRYFVLGWGPWARAALYAGLCGYLVVFSQHVETKFIYFQF